MPPFLLSRTSRFPEYHGNSLKNSDGLGRTQCLRHRCGNRITDNGHTTSDGTRSDPDEVNPAVRWMRKDNTSSRMFGSILQTGDNLYVVAESHIWNKLGERMKSSIDSALYHTIGYIYAGPWSKSNWFHKDMLKLRE